VYNIGRRRDSYEEQVTVFYTNANGAEHFYGSMTWDVLKKQNKELPKKDRNDWVVEIATDDVKSITVILENIMAAGSTAKAKVPLGEIEYCTWQYPGSGN